MSKWIRQFHRWVAVVFTLTAIANFVDMAVRPGGAPGLVTYSPLPPLFLLLVSGLYLFALPYVTKWQSSRS
jgi:hypothetical protein